MLSLLCFYKVHPTFPHDEAMLAGIEAEEEVNSFISEPAVCAGWRRLLLRAQAIVPRNLKDFGL